MKLKFEKSLLPMNTVEIALEITTQLRLIRLLRFKRQVYDDGIPWCERHIQDSYITLHKSVTTHSKSVLQPSSTMLHLPTPTFDDFLWKCIPQLSNVIFSNTSQSHICRFLYHNVLILEHFFFKHMRSGFLGLEVKIHTISWVVSFVVCDLVVVFWINGLPFQTRCGFFNSCGHSQVVHTWE